MEPLLDEVEWRSPEFVNAYGVRTENVLEYFSQSPFWDRQCNNQQLKMQRGGWVPTTDAELRRFRGVEYVVGESGSTGTGNDLWIIYRQRRVGDSGDDDKDVVVECCYFIVGSRVFQSTNINSILVHGCLSITESLRHLASDLAGDGDKEAGAALGDKGDTNTAPIPATTAIPGQVLLNSFKQSLN